MQDVKAYLYYRLIYDFLSKEIEEFALHTMQRVAAWASAFALVLVTIWILIQGYRALTGQMREPLMATVLHMGRIVVVVSAATTTGFSGTDLHTFLTQTVDKQVHA